MASFTGALFLAYLLSVSFTDTVQLNLSSVQKLVDYEYNFNFSQLIPGQLYNGSIRARFAVPDAALAGLEGKSVFVKISASADPNSSVFFPVLSGVQSKEAQIYLRCDVANGSCANSSVLSAEMPVLASAKPDSEQLAKIYLTSEIVQGESAGSLQAQAGGILDSIKGSLTQNVSAWQNTVPPVQQPNGSISGPSQANKTGAQDFLDSLKPEGDSKNPVQFLKENPLISLTALLIVIIITGAYLLNAKD